MPLMKGVAVVACAIAWCSPMVAARAAAQGTERPPYRSNPADEDWTFLKTAPDTDAWDPVKYIALGPDDWSLTLSGELRYRPEGFRVHTPPGRPSTVDNYFLQRYLFGTDFRLGRRLRLFGELQSGIVNGRFQSQRPTDRNSLDVHQAFVEWRPAVRGTGTLGITIGRQEIEIGSSRLISASPGLNVKRSFDGVVAAYRQPTWTLTGVLANLVPLRAGAFNDAPDLDQRFWGVAAGRRGPAFQRSDLGIYYLGIDRTASVYAQGLGPELRHTTGLKWSGSGTRLDVNYDAVFQWGRFDGAPIRAWAFATETSYRFRTAWRPRVSVRTDVASGDDDSGDPALQSFNPLFPGNAYSGAVGLLGPTNLTDFTPGLTLFPHQSLTLGVELPSYWRTSTADGVYATDLRVLFRPEIGEGKYVGTNPGVIVSWQATRHVQVQGAVTRFLSGGFLERTFVARGFGFYSITTRYRF